MRYYYESAMNQHPLKSFLLSSLDICRHIWNYTLRISTIYGRLSVMLYGVLLKCLWRMKISQFFQRRAPCRQIGLMSRFVSRLLYWYDLVHATDYKKASTMFYPPTRACKTCSTRLHFLPDSRTKVTYYSLQQGAIAAYSTYLICNCEY